MLQDGAGAAPISRSAVGAISRASSRRLDAIRWRAAGTAFQRKVWTALTTIPAGKTHSYGALAARLGMPQAVRAVGLANGSNPISIVVPCHRVIGADGSLTGYGGGLERKRWLLRARRRGAEDGRARGVMTAAPRTSGPAIKPTAGR